MNSFPIIKRDVLIGTFDSIVELYHQDSIKILDSAELAFAQFPAPFIKDNGAIAPQLEVIKHKVRQIADNQGRKALVLLLEALYTNLLQEGAIGVSRESFCDTILIEINNNSCIKFLSNGHWFLEWRLPIPQGNEIISIPLRKSDITENDIVPEYIMQYVNQSISAYNSENYLTALSLISIALEGTLRDALATKGYTYTNGAQTMDAYELKNAEVLASQDGYQIEFQDAMPRHQNDFLSEAEQNPPHQIRIKRVNRNSRWFLEIRDVDYLRDFWSSDVISQPGQINISGLGTALRVARDVTKADILDVTILATDIDEVIQQVRNNLIHLSGDAMTNTLAAVNMSLEEFAADQARVFDTVSAICDAIDKLYSKIADYTI